jgi:transcriptional regulator with XRE-family HTH domain
MNRIDKLYSELGEVVRARRKAQGLTQDELSETSGLHDKYIGQVERGEVNITLSNLAKIAKGLGCSIADLFPRGKTSKANSSLATIIALLETKDEKYLKTLLKVLRALD